MLHGPWNCQLPLKAKGLKRVMAFNVDAITMERLDSDDFNMIIALNKRDEDQIIEKLAGLYYMRGPTYMFEKTGDNKVSQELYINQIANKTWAVRFDGYRTMKSLTIAVDLVAQCKSELVKRGLLDE